MHSHVLVFNADSYVFIFLLEQINIIVFCRNNMQQYTIIDKME